MPEELHKKQEIFAIFSVVILFFMVGSLLFIISYQNKQKTQILKNKVLVQKIINEDIKKLEKIELDISFLPELTSKSFLTLIVTNNGPKKILIQQNSDLPLPIASITKLMVAIVALENFSLETGLTATPDYIGKEESAYILEIDKIYKVRELLANALIASDNDSARLLSSLLGEKIFVNKMNLKAKELGLTQTNFVNVTGLDPEKPALGPVNVSSATDLANLIIYIKNKHPEILKITTNSQYNFCDIDNYCKNITNTNKILKNQDFKYKIFGGKTGSTDLAGKNLVLVTEITSGVSLINVVLGSIDNFSDTLSLINQIKIEY